MPCLVLAIAALSCTVTPGTQDVGEGDAEADEVASIVATGLRCERTNNPVGVTAAAPRLSWWLERVDAGTRGDRQSAYRILVASSLDRLQNDNGDLWDTGKVPSEASLDVPYQGRPLPAWGRLFWKIRLWDGHDHRSPWSSVADWTMGPLSTADWAGAQWIVNDKLSDPDALPIFRRAFTIGTRPTEARLAVTAMGGYEILLNGQPVTSDVLTPGWTNYRKSVPFQVYEVGALLAPGENVLAVRIGHGMDHVPGQRYAKFVGSFGPPKLLACLHMKDSDGAVTTVVTDALWTTRASPITFSSIYGGEDFDARLEPAGWTGASFDDRDWPRAVAAEGPGGTLVATGAPPQRVVRELDPVAVSTPRPGVQVYDLGQNISGWPLITAEGPAGTAIRLTTGELVDASGMVTQSSTGGPTWFTYVLAGAGQESWSPRFTFTGFRYVQVEGGGAVVHRLQGQWVHLAAERTGQLETSNAQLNQIFALIDAAFRNNLHSVLTDCPHREKLGWLESAHLLGRSLMYDFDLAGFYAKVAADMAEAQTADGLVPDVAPEYTIFGDAFRDSPEWGSAAALVPFYAADVYGDTWLEPRHLDAMTRYLAYLRSREVNGLLDYGLGDWFDVGPGESGVSQLTSLGLTASAIYFQDLQAAAWAARRLGTASLADELTQRAQKVREAFNTAYFHADIATYDRGSQTALAMPLVLGLVPDDQRAAVQATLVARVVEDGFHITAGDVGWVYVLRALEEADRGDIIIRLLLNPDGPGYLTQIRKGATALTESWDAVPIYSQDHAMLGQAHEWLYGGLAGVRSQGQGNGFRHLDLRPQPVADVAWVDARYRSAHGPILSRWELRAGVFHWLVRLPPNTSATVHVPASSADQVTEHGVPLRTVIGVAQVRQEGRRVAFELDSGEYDFAAAPAPP